MYFVMTKTMMMVVVRVLKGLRVLMLVIITSTLRYFHTDIVSPIFPIGRVVRILLREQKKKEQRKEKEKQKKKIFAIKSVEGENVIDSRART